MGKIFKVLVFSIVVLTTVTSAQSNVELNLLSEAPLTNEGLYFYGEKGVDYIFGKQITPHGDCIDVINGYVFVAWYKGGMENRNLMLSRKKVNGTAWETIEFPYPHVGFRGNPKIGDSHNRSAICICPIDGTVHVVFDLHAYRKKNLPDRYFSYLVSEPNMAFAKDWKIENFNPLRNHLREDGNYERLTYPEFNRFDDGRIMLDLRIGGSGNGSDLITVYDGKEWSKMFKFNNGNQPNKQNYNFYSSFNYLYGKLYMAGSIRYGLANSDDNFKYVLNNGLFYASANPPYGKSDWKDIGGNSVEIPIQNPDVIKVAEPCDILPEKKRMSSPSWVVSESGDIHYLVRLGRDIIHYYKKAEDKDFVYSLEGPKIEGDLFCVGDHIVLVGLEKGYPTIKVTPVGQNNWTTLLNNKEGDRFQHCVVTMAENRIYFFAMKRGNSDKLPITLLTYELSM